jgi:chromosome segregation ATPase
MKSVASALPLVATLLPNRVESFAWNAYVHRSRWNTTSNLKKQLACRPSQLPNDNNLMHSLSSSDGSPDENEPEPSNAITDKIERLQQQLTYIEALEERNKAQIDSFIDEQDQWDSMEEDERQLLQSKTGIEERLEQLTSELINLLMGGKSMDG